MHAIALHTELRNALALSDELGRYEYALGNEPLASQLAALRTTISDLEREAGKTHRFAPVADEVLIAQLERSLDAIREHAEEIPLELRPRVVMLMDAVERIVFAEQRPSAPVPSKKVLRTLPLARAVPQDVHSAGDYLIVASYVASAIVARTGRGRAVGLALAGVHGGVSLTTDMKLSLAKWIPIEVHEVVDYLSGAGGCLTPLALGCWRADPVASAIQMVAGIGTVALSLFADYRAVRGITIARRSKGGPKPRRWRRAARVPEAQRPLEGFAGPSFIPRIATLED